MELFLVMVLDNDEEGYVGFWPLGAYTTYQRAANAMDRFILDADGEWKPGFEACIHKIKANKDYPSDMPFA